MVNLRFFLTSLRIKESDFIVPQNSNLFLGGITGRTGTTWLMRVLRDILGNEYVVIGEHGSFVLSQLRKAGYEYYQATPGSSKNRESYLRYFYEFMANEAYDRRKIYGEGLLGLCRIVPRRAIKLAFNALKEDLEDAQSLRQCNICFGNFYSHLLNFHSMLRGGTLNWISKEPPYGRHIKDLYDMIPDCRVVVMVRDGRDTALSMAKRGWCNGETIRCIDRWRDFTQMTLGSLQYVPNANYLLVNYEQLLLDFAGTLRKILVFYRVEAADDIIKRVHVENYRHAPRKTNFDKWKKELTKEEITYFEQTCGDIVRRLGYET